MIRLRKPIKVSDNANDASAKGEEEMQEI